MFLFIISISPSPLSLSPPPPPQVCNHPDLFERRNVISPSSICSVPTYTVPRLVYYQLLLPDISRHRCVRLCIKWGVYNIGICCFLDRLLTQKLGVLSSYHIHLSSGLSGSGSGRCEVSGCWSFLKFVDMSPHEASTVMLGPFTQR